MMHTQFLPRVFWAPAIVAWATLAVLAGTALLDAPAMSRCAAAELEFPRDVLTDSNGAALSLAEARGRAGTVLLTLSVECPICSEYLQTIKQLGATLGERAVNLIAIDPNASETIEQMSAFKRDHQLGFPFVQDPGAKVARRLQLSVTPEVCLFDSKSQLVYRGRIDDRYRSGAQGAAVTKELELAVDAMIAGRAVANPRTRPVGCPIIASPARR